MGIFYFLNGEYIMDKERTQRKLDAFLPASACEKSLYDLLTAEARKRGKSRAALIREAVEKFLHESSLQQGNRNPKKGK